MISFEPGKSYAWFCIAREENTFLDYLVAIYPNFEDARKGFGGRGYFYPFKGGPEFRLFLVPEKDPDHWFDWALCGVQYDDFFIEPALAGTLSDISLRRILFCQQVK